MKKRVPSLKTFLTLCSVSLAVILLVASYHSSSEASDVKASMPAAPEERPQSFSKLVKGLKPAVVNISTTQVIKQRGFKGMPGHPGQEQDPFP